MLRGFPLTLTELDVHLSVYKSSSLKKWTTATIRQERRTYEENIENLEQFLFSSEFFLSFLLFIILDSSADWLTATPSHYIKYTSIFYY